MPRNMMGSPWRSGPVAQVGAPTNQPLAAARAACTIMRPAVGAFRLCRPGEQARALPSTNLVAGAHDATRQLRQEFRELRTRICMEPPDRSGIDRDRVRSNPAQKAAVPLPCRHCNSTAKTCARAPTGARHDQSAPRPQARSDVGCALIGEPPPPARPGRRRL
jgi:hypothetical protein